MKLKLLCAPLVALGCAMSFASNPSETQVTVNGQTITAQILTMEVIVGPQCKTKYCDSADADCDGVLDEVCPGLEYNVCKDGSIVEAYVDAALTGFCLQDSDPKPSCGDLVVSPAPPCED